MRIAYILNTLETGGAERQVLALAEQMRARGHAVKVLVLREPAAHHLCASLDAVYLRMRSEPFSAMAGFIRAIRDLREFRPDVLQGNQFHGNMLARLLHIAMPAVPVISTIHNVYEGPWHRMFAYRISDRLSGQNLFVCSAAAERFASLHACSPERSRVITNGIDLAKFTPDFARRLRVRAEMEVGASFVWLAACRIVPAKDIANLLRAFATVRSREPSVQLWIAGEGTASYVLELERLSRELGNEPAVRWLGLQSDVAALLDAADGFVLSSAWEGLPLALGEAMAMEKLFVATNVGGVRELAGTHGDLVPARDEAALADAMLATMQMSPTQMREAGFAARDRIASHFNLHAKSLEWERLYLEVAARR